MWVWIAGGVLVVLVIWMSRCRHEHERFSRSKDGRRIVVCNECGRKRLSIV